jgi:hypothetical protein
MMPPKKADLIIYQGATFQHSWSLVDAETSDPVDQQRDPEFEKMIESLIVAVLVDAETTFDKVYLDMEII